jgi:TonB family protein
MKAIYISLLLIVHSFAFGQSAKKLNKQLRSELLVAQQKQDSVYRIFLEEQQILEQVRTDVQNRIKTQLAPESEKLRERTFDITHSVNLLKNLEINTTDVFPDGTDFFKSQPRYKSLLKKPIDEMIWKAVKFEFVSAEELNPDTYKRKEQNEMLHAFIRKYETYADHNKLHMQDQRKYIEGITALYPRIDSLLGVYQVLNRELETKSEVLTKRIAAARENYRLKGPKGFPNGYSVYFPEIHPVQVKPFVYDRETDMEGFDAIPAPPPAPVEVRNLTGESQEPEIYMVLDEYAEFPGGRAALQKYLDNNLQYPTTAKEMGIQGKAYLKFVVSDKGEISNVQILKGVSDCPECDKEAIRVVKGMPKWIPGKNNGKAVASWFNLPVKFELK